MIRIAISTSSFLLAIWFLCQGVAVAQPATQKPNVLFIVADDMSPDWGCYGHKVAKTPNFDRLAKEGALFERAFCQHPVCNASRTTFLSGLRSVRGRSPVFMPNWFRQQGYYVAEFGKVAHSYGISREQTEWDLQERATVERIVEFLGQARDKPTFTAIGLTHTHVGFNHTREMLALYDAEKIELSQVPPGFRESHPDAAFAGVNINTEQTAADRRKHVARYYAAISTIDEIVGELMAALDRNGLRENTIVVFTSDHGLHLGDRGGIYDKRTLWDRSTHVPLVVAAPGLKSASRISGLVELVDIYPTLAELCGIEAPKELEGQSFAPLLKEPTRPWKKAAFSSTIVRGTRGKALRTDRYRYVEWNDGKTAMLYDHQSDPGEYTNLAEDAAHADTVAELKKLLEAGWQAALPAEK